VYTQRTSFRLVSYHLVQKGPTFPIPMEVSIDGSTGRVTVRYTEDGKEQVDTEQMQLPVDVANGMVPTLAKTSRPGRRKRSCRWWGRRETALVKLKITQVGQESFTREGPRYDATHYLVKVISGRYGRVGDAGGQEPAGQPRWIVGGAVPGFVKAEMPLYLGGPACGSKWRARPGHPRRARNTEIFDGPGIRPVDAMAR